MEVVRNWQRVREAIARRASLSGRSESSVRLIAVSKTWPREHIEPVVEAGQLLLGENKLQEGEEKIPAMSESIEWHYIGGLQRNKVRKVLSLFSVIHSIDSLKLALYTDRVAAELGIKAKVLLQINIGAEEQKKGFSPAALKESIPDLLECQHLDIQGLMCIPPAVSEPELARPYFRQLREFRDELEQMHDCHLPELSMGMSLDYEVAIEEGATLVRVGSSIFGARSYEAKK